ncbi:hypothetical protein AMK32_23395 [Streptomyces sp. CB01883]|nr:hypothetical protein AMK32_23395 [Streptomyces sp. CB01883]
MGLLLVYGLNTWLPKLMNDAGYPVPTAVTQLLILNVGGAAGLVLGGFVADRRGIKLTTLGWFAVSVVMLAALSVRMGSDLLLDTVVGAGHRVRRQRSRPRARARAGTADRRDGRGSR